MTAMTKLEEVVASSQRISPRTQKLYQNRVAAFVKFAGRSPKCWTTLALERWRDKMLADGLRPETVNLYLAAVQFAAKRLERLELGVDFAKAAERARTDPGKDPPRVLTVKECRRLLETCNDPNNPADLRDRAMILVGIHTGMRRTSICAVEFDDLHGRNLRFIAKGRRFQAVNLADEPWAALETWRMWLIDHGVKSGRIFRSLRHSIASGWTIGPRISPDAFAKRLRARGEAAGIESLHPHVLRHTYTSLALAAGVPAWRVQKTLGHKTPAMLERYTHDLDPTPIGDEFPTLTDD